MHNLLVNCSLCLAWHSSHNQKWKYFSVGLTTAKVWTVRMEFFGFYVQQSRFVYNSCQEIIFLDLSKFITHVQNWSLQYFQDHPILWQFWTATPKWGFVEEVNRKYWIEAEVVEESFLKQWKPLIGKSVPVSKIMLRIGRSERQNNFVRENAIFLEKKSCYADQNLLYVSVHQATFLE